MSCLGKCYSPFICECKCFEDCECDEDNCLCDHKINCFYILNPEHRNCVVYCKFQKTCCSLVKCNNYFLCRNEIPEYVYRKNNYICNPCYVNFGNINNTNSIDECYVCMCEKNMISLNCGHSLCGDCLENWFIGNDCRSCPICRQDN